jgi:hypothetical protein
VRIARSATLALVASYVAILSCSSSSTSTCTCAVANNGERRSLVCGETACVGGTTYVCTDNQQIVTQGACIVVTPPPDTQPGQDASAPPPPDPSCDNLRSFCNSSCNNPASVAADCQSVASAGDPGSCTSWQSTNSALCKP